MKVYSQFTFVLKNLDSVLEKNINYKNKNKMLSPPFKADTIKK